MGSLKERKIIPVILVEDYEMKIFEDEKIANERTQLLPKKKLDRDESDDVTDVIYPLLPQLCASLVSCLNTLSSGITVAYTSPAIPELRHPSKPSGVEFGDDETALFAAMIGTCLFCMYNYYVLASVIMLDGCKHVIMPYI